jgi:hypothetical protein
LAAANLLRGLKFVTRGFIDVKVAPSVSIVSLSFASLAVLLFLRTLHTKGMLAIMLVIPARVRNTALRFVQEVVHGLSFVELLDIHSLTFDPHVLHEDILEEIGRKAGWSINKPNFKRLFGLFEAWQTNSNHEMVKQTQTIGLVCLSLFEQVV